MVKTCRTSRTPRGSLYLPEESLGRPGTSEVGCGFPTHVDQPSKSRPFQSGRQPDSAEKADATIPITARQTVGYRMPGQSGRLSCVCNVRLSAWVLHP